MATSPWSAITTHFQTLPLPNQFLYKSPKTLFKSRDGALWLPFDNQLVVVRGKSTFIFDVPGNALAGNTVPFFVQHGGNHYMAVGNTLYQLQFSSEQLDLRMLKQFEGSFVTALKKSSQGVFVLTLADLYQLEVDTGQVVPLNIHDNAGERLKDAAWMDVLFYQDQPILVSDSGQMVHFNRDKQQVDAISPLLEGQWVFVTLAKWLDDSRVLLATNRGLFEYHVKSGQAKRLLGELLSGAVADVLVNDAGVWLISGGEVWRSGKDLKTAKRLEGRRHFSLADDVYEANLLYTDDEGVLWALINNQGVFHYAPSASKIHLLAHLNETANRRANAVLKVGDHVWLANEAGIFKDEQQVYSDGPVLSLHQHNDVIYGGAANQLIALGGQDRVARYTFKSGPYAAKIASVAVDHQGNFWLTAQEHGLIYYNRQTGKGELVDWLNFDAAQRRSVKWVSNHPARADELILFTADKTLLVNTARQQMSVATEHPQKLERVQMTQNNGYVWFADGSIERFDLNALQYQPVSQTLAAHDPLCLVPDGLADHWLVNREGNLLRVGDQSPIAIGTGAGIPKGGLNGEVCMAMGEGFYFSGYAGVYQIQPGQFQFNRFKPQVHIGAVQLAGQAVNLGADTRLAQSNKPLNIEFYSASYAAVDNNRLRSRLAGSSRQWRHHSPGHAQLTYSRLPAGQYELQLQSANNDGVWGDVRSVSFEIVPPWWRTGWALALWTLLAVALLWLSHFWRVRRLSARARVLETLVADRTRALADEKVTVEQLLAAREQAFLTMSHELRTPLTLIVGPLKRSLESPWKQTTKAGLSVVYRNAVRLLHMVDQLLYLEKSRIEQGGDERPQDLVTVIGFIMDSFALMAEKQGVRLQTGAVDQCYLRFSDDALEKVLINLVSNAIKYADKGASVQVSAQLQPQGDVHIAVRDTGRGMDEAQLARIFERYYRAPDESGNAVSGVGIGLALVRELVEAHQGQITVTSVKGKGSTFTVSVPADRVGFEAGPQKAFNEELVRIALASEDSWRVEAQQQGDMVSGNQERASVLVIEDNPDLLNYVCQTLSGQFDCLRASDGLAGMELAFAELPNLIISDVNMPGKDGFAVCETLKNDERTSHIPIILLTARGDQSSRMEGWKSLADEYLVKPFDHKELLLRIENLLVIRALLRSRLGQDVVAEAGMPADTHVGLGERDRIFLSRLAEALEQGYPDPEFSITELASAGAMSERQLQRKLKGLLDMSPVDYIRQYRLQKSKQLLLDGKRVSDVAEAVGFTSGGYYSKCFKARFNKTPLAFAKEGE